MLSAHHIFAYWAMQALRIVLREDRVRVMEQQGRELRGLVHAPGPLLRDGLDLSGVDDVLSGCSTIAFAANVIHRIRAHRNQANFEHAHKIVRACSGFILDNVKTSRKVIRLQRKRREFVNDGLAVIVFEAASGKKVRPFSPDSLPRGTFPVDRIGLFRRVRDIVQAWLDHYRLSSYPGLRSCVS